MFTKGKLILLAVLSTILIGLFISNHYKGKEVKKLEKAVVVHEVANKVLEKTIKVDKAVATVTSKTNVKLSKDIDHLTAKRTIVIYKVKQQLDQIKVDTNIPLAEVDEGLILKRSEVLINGLWEQFCNSVESHPSCNK